MAHFHGIEPRVIEHILLIVIQVDGLLDGFGVDAGQAAHGQGEVTVGTRIVDTPVGVALSPVESGLELPVGLDVIGRVHETGEGPLAGSLIVLGNREVVVLPGRVFAKRPLGEERAQQNACDRETQNGDTPHSIPV